MGTIVVTTLYAFIGNALVYIGIAFMSGRLFPETTLSISHPIRMALFLLMFSLPASLLIGKAISVGGGAVSSVAILTTLVIVLFAQALLLDGVKLGWTHLLPLVATMASAAWLAMAISTPANPDL